MPQKEYIPFGEEWKKHLMKMSKETIIGMFRNTCIEKIQLENKLERIKNELER